MDSALSSMSIGPPISAFPWTPPLPRLPSRFCPHHRYAPSLRPKTLLRSTISRQRDGNPDDVGGPASESTSPSSISNLTVEELEQKLGKRRRSRSQEKTPSVAKPPPKDWDSMTLAEKTWELYVGEKGALYWLNKLAYAAIFVLVGGWIAFRFIGPALNLYQLESPLLPPDQVFGGSE